MPAPHVGLRLSTAAPIDPSMVMITTSGVPSTSSYASNVGPKSSGRNMTVMVMSVEDFARLVREAQPVGAWSDEKARQWALDNCS